MFQQEWVQSLQDILTIHFGMYGDRQCFPCVFVQYGEHFILSAVTEPVMNEVDAPDVIGILRPQADNRTVFVIEPFALFVTLRQLQTFLTPYPLNPLVIDVPALDLQQLCNLAITIPAILLGQSD